MSWKMMILVELYICSVRYGHLVAIPFLFCGRHGEHR
jgi:hypothetical protein